MKQLFWKEWREHSKFALLGLAIFTLLLVLVVRDGNTQLNAMAAGMGGTIIADTLQPLAGTQVLMMSVVFCAIFGVVLGWLQIHAERHPDLRAFLMHRPINPMAILAGKLWGGFALYTLGAGVPLLGLVIYVLMPGHVAAPFEWAMVLPGVIVFLLGLVFYAAGLLIGLRSVRWFGSRIFGLGPALLVAMAAFAVPEFWQALALIVIAGAILGLAVWTGFPAGGIYRDQAWPGKLALSMVCALAVLLLFLPTGALLYNVLSGPKFYHYSNYQLNNKGEVFQITGGFPGSPTFADANGQPLVDPRTGRKIKQEDFDKQNPAPVELSVTVDFKRPQAGQEGFARNARFFAAWRMAGKTLWYLTRHGELVGYDSVTRRLVGTLRPDEQQGDLAVSGNGFRWGERNYNPGVFQSEDNQREVLATDKTLYLVDVENRTLKPLFAATNADVIGGFAEDPNEHHVLVASRNFICEINLQDGTQLATPFEPGWPKYSQVVLSWLEPTNQFALRFKSDDGDNQYIKWLASDGGVLRSEKLPTLPAPRWNEDKVGKSLGVAFPPLTRAVAAAVLDHYGAHYPFDKWDAWSFVPAVLSALIGWGVGRRYGFALRDQAAWAVFHVLLGVPGLLAFFCVQEWPAKEACPKCGKLRRVDREHCDDCGAVFAPPARNGTEIFEEARTT